MFVRLESGVNRLGSTQDFYERGIRRWSLDGLPCLVPTNTLFEKRHRRTGENHYFDGKFSKIHAGENSTIQEQLDIAYATNGFGVDI